MSIWSSSKFDRSVCSCEFKVNFLIFLMFIPLGFWSRNYWNYLNHPLTANIWEKAILILAGNLNWGLSYLITTVLTLHDLVLALKIHQELRLHPRHPIDFDQNSDWIPWKFQMNAWMIFDCSKVSWYWNYLENKWSSVSNLITW